MGRHRFLSVLLVSIFLFLCCSLGFGRKMMETVEHEDSTVQLKESAGKSREMIEIMDYSEPGPNINTKGGFITTPPQAFP